MRLGLLVLGAAFAWAQLPAWAVVKIVGPDGRVTYTDQPGAAADASAQGSPGQASTAATDGLPYALRQTALRHPVVLYAQSPCAPCDAGRAYLVQRGIPYQEYTLNRPADQSAFAARFQGSSLPLLTIGGKRLEGFQQEVWADYLDAAGYPASSALGPRYRAPAALPLAHPSGAGDAAASAPAGSASAAPPQPAASPGPGLPGFRF